MNTEIMRIVPFKNMERIYTKFQFLNHSARGEIAYLFDSSLFHCLCLYKLLINGVILYYIGTGLFNNLFCNVRST